jgi:hypothetical protein
MTTKADFTDEEWARLKRAPFVAGMAISLADPGGPIEAFKETKATLQSVLDAARGGDHGQLASLLAGEVAAAHENPLSGFRPKGAMAGDEILGELRGAQEIVTAKAPDEADAYRDWLLATAQAAANAAKEGGFMGFKAEVVSEGEQKMLDRLKETLA